MPTDRCNISSVSLRISMRRCRQRGRFEIVSGILPWPRTRPIWACGTGICVLTLTGFSGNTYGSTACRPINHPRLRIGSTWFIRTTASGCNPLCGRASKSRTPGIPSTAWCGRTGACAGYSEKVRCSSTILAGRSASRVSTSMSRSVSWQRRRSGKAKRFRNMADAAPVMIWVSGPDKLCTFFSKGWLQFTGRTMQQELGKGWMAGVYPDDLERCEAGYSSSFDAHRSFQMEYRLRRADGDYRWVLDSGVPRFAPSGVFVGYIGSCVDITDHKRIQEEHLAKQKLEIVGTLANGIAHDFNNLLGGVLAQSELVLGELASGSPLEGGLQNIRAAAIRGAQIVRQLMIYAGRESEVLELVDVSRIVEDMLELVKVSVSKHVVVETDLAKDLPAVRANPAQIRQVVMNLLTNASDAIGDRDGVIRVTTGQVTPGCDSPVVLEVSDTGRGMTPEMQAKVFDPFVTTKSVGHGLGLAVVQGIVWSLHGTIQLLSAPGKGTTFQISLPCEERLVQSRPRLLSRTGGEARVSRGSAILVVEDEGTLRQAVSKMLRQKGLSVIEASDGSAALDVIRAQKDHIHVLLLDISLPGASSREVLEEAKRLRSDLAVIVTSAYSQEVAAASLGSHVERFIRKPYSFGDLIGMIREML